MSRRRARSRPQRSVGEWSVRGLLAVGLAVLGYFALTFTLGQGLRASPARAYALAPSDGRLAALLSQRQITASLKPALPAERAQAAELARRALRLDATALPAAFTLGLDAQLRGKSQQARRLIAYSQKLSRRDLPTQLWAIEDAVARGDIVGALGHYDIALRTSRSAPDVLFPILSLATADSAIRAPLAKLLATRPIWGDAFIGHLVGSGADWRSVADLFWRVRRLGGRIPSDAEATAVSGLISSGFPAEAWRYYAAIRPGVDRRTVRDGGFTAGLPDPSPLDWVALNDEGMSTVIEKGGVDFAAPPSVGGPALRQMQMLPPGSYALSGRVSEIEQAPTALPFWQLLCADGRELGRVTVPSSGSGSRAFAGQLTVPRDCPVQTLLLVVRASDVVSGATGRIEQVRLRPLS